MCYFFLHIRENYILYQQKHAFNQPRCMYFSALPPRTPCVCIFWSFVMWMKALLCTIPPNTKFTGKTNHSYTTTKQLEKRFWLCQKFRGQLFVPEPVVRRKGEKSINALAPLLLGAVAIFRMFVSTFYNGTILVTFRSERHTCGISGNYKFTFIFISYLAITSEFSMFLFVWWLYD